MQQTSFSLGGLWLPLVTPFLDGELDDVSFHRLIEFYLGEKLDGLIVAATTGEGLTLGDDELSRLCVLAAGAVQGRIPVFLGLAGSDTARLAAMVERTAAWPVDGYLVTCPYYSRPSQQGLFDHFAALAGRTERPMALYNIPYRTGVNLLNETLIALADIANIVGLKDCCADPAQSFDLIRRKPAGFAVMTGEDAQFYNALVHGADGAILASAHVETDKFAAVGRLLAAGDRIGALNQWCAITDLTRLLFEEPSPGAIKHWLWRQGLIRSAELRLPMTCVSPALADRIDRAMAACGVVPVAASAGQGALRG